ncbi:MAG: RIP metalloprotease RseP [Terriglobales bacterium]
MNHILVNIIAVAVVLGVVVFVHEAGHFVAAKIFGVRVETFSLGFGTRLLGVRHGGTDYRISLLPLGGYVRMAGENPMDQPSGHPDELLSKPRWQRFIIALAGPLMNGVLAVLLLVPIYMREFPHNPVLDAPAVVAEVQPKSAAAIAGIKPEDRIAAIAGKQNPDWETVFLQSAISIGHALPMTLDRGGKVIHTEITPVSSDPNVPPDLGIAPVEATRFDTIEAGSPAQRAGMLPGDRILAVNGTKVLDPGTLIDDVQKAEPSLTGTALGSTGHPVQIEVERGQQRRMVAVTPKLEENQGQRQWMIGASFENNTTSVRLPFSQALHQSLEDNKVYSEVILSLVGKLVSRQASIKTLQSPVGIASMTGQAARAATLLPLFSLTSLISLNLGILNLLPIPMLDGGMILFLLIESLLRHDISLRVKERIYQAGFAFLLVLMTVVVYNDIVRAVVVRN